MLRRFFSDGNVSFLERTLAAPLQAVSKNRHFAAIQAGCGMMLYGYFAVSVLTFAALFPSQYWQTQIAALKPQMLAFGQIITTFCCLTGAFGTAYSLARSYSKNAAPLACGVYALTAMLLLLPANGTDGFFTALATGLISVHLYVFTQRLLKHIKLPPAVPPNILPTFTAPLGGMAVLVFWWLLRYVFSLDINAALAAIGQPLVNLFATPLLSGLVFFLDRFLWLFGIHGSTLLCAAMSPLWAKMSLDNINAVVSGYSAMHICTNEFINYYPRVSFLPAIAALWLFGGKPQRELAKVAWLPATFNIAEPVLFGLPLVMNPWCILPWLFGSMLLFGVDYLAVLYNYAPAPFLTVPWTTPHLLMSYLGTAGDWRALALTLFNNLVMFALWIPVALKMRSHRFQ